MTEIRTTVEERRLISVATIQAALGFNFRITGLGIREAQDLALLLRAGALAAPMYIVEERTVGAQLGDENVERGFFSVAIGFLLVLVFMLVLLRLRRFHLRDYDGPKWGEDAHNAGGLSVWASHRQGRGR